jgi:hypothetical protein
VRRTLNFFESYEKEKRFGIYSIFVKFFHFFEKKMNFPGGPKCQEYKRKLFVMIHGGGNGRKQKVAAALVILSMSKS